MPCTSATRPSKRVRDESPGTGTQQRTAAERESAPPRLPRVCVCPSNSWAVPSTPGREIPGVAVALPRRPFPVLGSRPGDRGRRTPLGGLSPCPRGGAWFGPCCVPPGCRRLSNPGHGLADFPLGVFPLHQGPLAGPGLPGPRRSRHFGMRSSGVGGSSGFGGTGVERGGHPQCACAVGRNPNVDRPRRRRRLAATAGIDALPSGRRAPPAHLPNGGGGVPGALGSGGRGSGVCGVEVAGLVGGLSPLLLTGTLRDRHDLLVSRAPRPCRCSNRGPRGS